jgi:hypothetical protein
MKSKIKYKVSSIDQRPPSIKEAKSRDPKFSDDWKKLDSDPLYIALLKRRREKNKSNHNSK